MLDFFKKHIWVLVIVMCIVTIPLSLTTQAELKMRVLVSGVAIDKADDGFELTAQIIMPSQTTDGSGVAKMNLVTAKGTTVADCINRVSYKIGKTLGVSHLSYVLVGDSFSSDYMPSVLDYFLRSRHLNNTLMVLRCEGKAKDEINKTRFFELGTGTSLQKIFNFKQTASNGIAVTVKEFINASHTKSGSAMISYVKINEDDLMKNSSSGDTKSSNSEQLKGRFEFINKIAYFKNGLQVGEFESEDAIKGVTFLNKKCKESYLTVENVNDEKFINAKLNMYARDKKVSISAKFENNIPTINAKIDFSIVEYREIINKSDNMDIYKSYERTLTKAVKDAIREKVAGCVKEAFKQAQEDGVDVFEFLNALYRADVKNFKKFAKENGENAILENIQLNVNVSIKKTA